MRGDEPVMSFGLMGGPMQAQGHAQMVVRLADYGQNPQAAADAPRFQVLAGREVAIETDFPPAALDELERRGHQLKRMPRDPMFGGAQLIHRLADGYCAASEPRKEGQAVGF
jgi:gamma-glutamyltranspeptidase/glutathione hydrolase